MMYKFAIALLMAGVEAQSRTRRSRISRRRRAGVNTRIKNGDSDIVTVQYRTMNWRQPTPNLAAKDWGLLDVTAVGTIHNTADATPITTTDLYLLVQNLPDWSGSGAAATDLSYSVVSGNNADLSECTWTGEATLQAVTALIPSTGRLGNAINAAAPVTIAGLDVQTWTLGDATTGRRIIGARYWLNSPASTGVTDKGESKDYILFLQADNFKATAEGAKKLGCGLFRRFNRTSVSNILTELMQPNGITPSAADQAIITEVLEN